MRSRTCASVWGRPCPWTQPITTSVPRSFRRHPSLSMAYVLPTPGAAPRYSRSFPRATVVALPALLSIQHLLLRQVVECDVQGQHVDARIAEDTQATPRGVGLDQTRHGGQGQSTGLGHGGGLDIRVGDGDGGIKP